MDVILIEGLEIRTIIGANDWEREVRQTVRLDLEMAWDTVKAGQSDDLQHTLDYFSVSQRLTALVESSQFFLLEALGEKCANVVLDEFAVPWVRLKVSKPLPYLGLKCAAIIIERGSKNGK